MNVLSLFDGMSCGRVALNRLGIVVDNYFASEIDEYAIKVAQNNFPDTIQLGDVLNWEKWDIDWSSIDIVMGGMPCQSWSIAGKQLGERDERGRLFFVMLDIIKKVMDNNPDAYYLIENVKMKREFEEYITYNTKKTLGENCVVNKVMINSNLVSAQNRQRYYWTNIEGITQPEDKGIVLKDILEDIGIDSDSFKRGGEMESYLPSPSFSADGLCQIGVAKLNGYDCLKRVYSEDGKAPTLNACTGGNREAKVFMEDHDKWRKLTPLECERLQTLPDNYTLGVSNSQRYKMIGNGWTVDVISHILKTIF